MVEDSSTRAWVALADGDPKEAVPRLLDLAATDDPASWVDDLPERLSGAMRLACRLVPGHPEDLSGVSSFCGVGSVAAVHEKLRHEREVRWRGLVRCHRHYWPDQALEPFEPMRSIGVIDSVRGSGDPRIAVGRLDVTWIRDHPILLVAADGTTQAVRSSAIVTLADGGGVVGVRIPATFAEHAINARLWVDRSAAR